MTLCSFKIGPNDNETIERYLCLIVCLCNRKFNNVVIMLFSILQLLRKPMEGSIVFIPFLDDYGIVIWRVGNVFVRNKQMDLHEEHSLESVNKFRDLESLYTQNSETYPTETYLLQRQVERSILKIEQNPLRGEDRFVFFFISSSTISLTYCT